MNGRIYTFGIKLYSAAGEQLDVSTGLNVILPEGRTASLGGYGNYLMFEIKENETAIIEGLKEGQYIRIAEKDEVFDIDGINYQYFPTFSGQDSYYGIGEAGYNSESGKFVNYLIAYNEIRTMGNLPSITGWDIISD